MIKKRMDPMIGEEKVATVNNGGYNIKKTQGKTCEAVSTTNGSSPGKSSRKGTTATTAPLSASPTP